MSRLSENMGASTSRKPKGLHGLHRDNFTLPYFFDNRRNICGKGDAAEMLIVKCLFISTQEQHSCLDEQIGENVKIPPSSTH
jgi:hypothetical protein